MMFKVIKGGQVAQNKGGAMGGTEPNLDVKLPFGRPESGDLLLQATKGMESEEEFMDVIQTFPTLGEFALKAADLVTPWFPASCNQYPSLLTEILDRAVLGYLRPANKSPREQMARFLVNGVTAATEGVLGYRVQHDRNDEEQVWLPWEDGALADWVDWKGGALAFTKSMSVTPEERYVTGFVMQRSLLSYAAALSIARAGLDLSTPGAF